MAILATGNSWSTGDQVTAALLNSAINSSTFASGAVDDSTTELNGSNQLIVKDGGVTPAKLSTGGPSWNTSSGLFVAGVGSKTTDGTGAPFFTGGSPSVGNGATMYLYGNSHVSASKDIVFVPDGTSSATKCLHYDHSASTWDFQANDITTTGNISGEAITASIETGITATGTTHATGYDITKVLTVFDTATVSDLSAALPEASTVIGKSFYISNTDDRNSMLVFPASGDSINNANYLTTPNSGKLMPRQTGMFTALDASTWQFSLDS